MNFDGLKQERKLIACNKQNSVSVVIPKSLLKLLQWEAGDIVEVGFNQDATGIEIKLK